MNDKPDPTIMNVAGMVCGCVMAIFVIGSITYSCTAPNQLDPEQQAIRVEQTQRVRACVAAGGDWIPVKDGSGRYADGASMSCVTQRTLPLVTKMNSGDN